MAEMGGGGGRGIQKDYLFQASGISKGREFLVWFRMLERWIKLSNGYISSTGYSIIVFLNTYPLDSDYQVVALSKD